MLALDNSSQSIDEPGVPIITGWPLLIKNSQYPEKASLRRGVGRLHRMHQGHFSAIAIKSDTVETARAAKGYSVFKVPDGCCDIDIDIEPTSIAHGSMIPSRSMRRRKSCPISAMKYASAQRPKPVQSVST